MTKEVLIPLQDDFNIWDKSKQESFIYINQRSRVASEWLSYPLGIEKGKHFDSIIKPINLYAQQLYLKPKLISINNNEIILQQQNHAEIFLLQEEDGLYHKDRPWIRQYYLSDKKYNELPQDCFEGIFRFYVPWIIDEEVETFIEQPEDSPFVIYPGAMNFKKIPKNTKIIDTDFVYFHFKNKGKHMVDQEFGKIPRFSPMYNIKFIASDIMVERVRKQYE
jgi:hypothetical protein